MCSGENSITRSCYVNGLKYSHWQLIEDNTSVHCDSYLYDENNCNSKCNKCNGYPQKSANLEGPAGKRGYQGPRGITGQTGAKGLQGIDGEVGLHGIQGIDGEVGLQGIQGIDGEVLLS